MTFFVVCVSIVALVILCVLCGLWIVSRAKREEIMVLSLFSDNKCLTREQVISELGSEVDVDVVLERLEEFGLITYVHGVYYMPNDVNEEVLEDIYGSEVYMPQLAEILKKQK